jgi:hypothetical protein
LLITLLIISLAIPISIGYCVVIVFWPRNVISMIELLFVLCLSIAAGFGISSCAFFIWIATVGSAIHGLIVLEVITLIIIATLIIIFKKNKISSPKSLILESATVKKLRKRVAICCAALLITYIIIFVIRSLNSPLGEGDGIAIWNMRARILFRAGEYWRDAFNMNMAHPDYPMLIPGSIACAWKFLNNESVLIPICIHMLFVLSVLGLLFSGLSIMRSTTQGSLAFIILLGTNGFVHDAQLQYADIPLAVFFLATIILFFMQEEVPKEEHGLVVLAGITSGLGAWTKNEGLLFVIAILCARSIVTSIRDGWKYCLHELYYFNLGLIPILSVIIYYKICFAPPNDIFLGLNMRYYVLVDISRYIVITKAFVDQFIYFGSRFISLPQIKYISLTMLLCLYSWMLGVKIDKRYERAIITTVLVLMLMWVGYFYIYIITSMPLKWQLATALKRLALQLWIPFLFLFFMIVRTPEEALSSALSN